MTTSNTKYIVNALQKSNINILPYEWMHIENIFSDEYYKLLKSTPLEEVQKMLIDDFNDPDVFDTVIEKFTGAPLNGDTINSIYAFWQSHGKGYTLKPHEDGETRIFTFTIYLADNNDYPEAGTAVYEVNENTKEYKTVSMIPYTMNSAMLIAPCKKRTWHGVNMLEHNIKRDSIVLVFATHKWEPGQMHYADWKSGISVTHVI